MKNVLFYFVFGLARGFLRRGNKLKLKPPKYGSKAAQTAKPTFMQVKCLLGVKTSVPKIAQKTKDQIRGSLNCNTPNCNSLFFIEKVIFMNFKFNFRMTYSLQTQH